MGGPPILPGVRTYGDFDLPPCFRLPPHCRPIAAPLPPTHPPFRALAQRRAMETAAAAAAAGSLVSPRRRKTLIPISYKIGVGMRYFFTENIGANLALGLGQGGLVNVGVSAKF